MKVTIETNEEKEQEITFPCLMVSKINKTIILAEGIHKGFIKGYSLTGIEYNKTWVKTNFGPLPKGTKVILES